ncbi:hypothetical protein [Celeribacter naphthalenivorans]|uniref:hypothetical protein n=1 Tax=Celeribacter naphthalenivorans TaxID=1614694 RepID=UPI001CFBDBEA|nr:hypothetical protein [Celeribacter naphthalenivorans]
MNTVPLTHTTVSPEGWLDLAENIESYRELKHAPLDSDLSVALEIAHNMALVARKRGVRAYTEHEVRQAAKRELEPGRDRQGIFDKLAALPFVELLDLGGVRAIRVFV